MDDVRRPDLKLAAVCGLFCPACSLFIATHVQPDRLPALAARMGKPADELRCDGCRSDRRCFFCREHCPFVACAAGKGLDFCGACPDYPCAALSAFQAERPHRIELWRNQARIREVGFASWYAEMVAHYSCPECGAINSAYDSACRKCGHRPGSRYVAEHGPEIAAAMAALEEKK